MVEYKGVKYYVQNSGYLHSREKYHGERLLHRRVWVEAHGRVKPGHHIHHKDGDKLNCALENLEEVPASEHHSMHMRELMQDPVHLKRMQDLAAAGRPKAAEWHRSPEGRAWHREHATGRKRDPEEFTCEFCGEDYMAVRTGKNRFCSNSCDQKYRYRKRKGLI